MRKGQHVIHEENWTWSSEGMGPTPNKHYPDATVSIGRNKGTSPLAATLSPVRDTKLYAPMSYIHF